MLPLFIYKSVQALYIRRKQCRNDVRRKMGKQHFYILRGLPGSGRTEKAKIMVEDNPWLIRASKEDIAFSMYGFYHPLDLDRFQTDNVKLLYKAQVEAALKAGLSVVDDNMNLDSTSVKELYILANRYNVEPEIIDFDLHFEKCIKNDNFAKGNGYGETYIRMLVKKFTSRGHILPAPVNKPEEIKSGRKYEPDTSLPKAFWLDADGTFFNMVPEIRGPFDFHLVHLDPVFQHIVNICKALVNDGYKVIVMSGRDEWCKDATYQAFVDAGVTPDEMCMRPNNTSDIHDYQIKEMLFWDNKLHEKYYVEFALDDRKSVVDYTREVLGIPVLQVAPGDF